MADVPHTADYGLRPDERLALARAVYRLTGYQPPKGEYDLSSVKNEVERVVEQIIATRPLPPGSDQGVESITLHPEVEAALGVAARVAAAREEAATKIESLGDEWNQRLVDLAAMTPPYPYVTGKRNAYADACGDLRALAANIRKGDDRG